MAGRGMEQGLGIHGAETRESAMPTQPASRPAAAPALCARAARRGGLTGTLLVSVPRRSMARVSCRPSTPPWLRR